MCGQSRHEIVNIAIDHCKTLLEIVITSAVRILNVRTNRAGPQTEQGNARRARSTLLSHSMQLRRLEHNDQIARQDQRCAQAGRLVILQINPAGQCISRRVLVGFGSVNSLYPKRSCASTDCASTRTGVGTSTNIAMTDKDQPLDRTPFDDLSRTVRAQRMRCTGAQMGDIGSSSTIQIDINHVRDNRSAHTRNSLRPLFSGDLLSSRYPRS